MARDESIDFLKGLAILAVIGLHIIPFFVTAENVSTEKSQNLLVLMNYFRFAVPFFVALSGLALARKYCDRSLQALEFLKKRVIKLLPLYLFWLAVITLIVNLVPGWAGFANSFPVWQRVLLGRGEYHLYFVPMIVSLYLLFPLLLWLTRKLGILAAILAILGQVWFYWYLGNIVIHDPTVKSLQTDQQQYVFFLSWLGYFVLGIYLGLNDWTKKIWVGVLALPLLATGLRWTVFETQVLLKDGYNIIFASGFTRLSVILYSVSGLITGLVFLPKVLSIMPRFFAPIIFLGRNSFLVYLSHTIFLRVLWGFFYQGTPIGMLVIPVVVWVIALLASLRFELIEEKVGLLLLRSKATS